MTPEASRAALRQMLTAWGRTVHRHPEKSLVNERVINTLIARCEARLARGATAADCVLLEIAPMLETTAERRLFRSQTAEIAGVWS